MNNLEYVTGMMVTLHVGGSQTLFIRLFSDGTVNRMGDGSDQTSELTLFIGKSPTIDFQRLCTAITPTVSQWSGSFADPSPNGKLCELVIGVQFSHGTELLSEWKYGSASQEPPLDIRSVVLDFIGATNPWFEEQILKRTQG